MNNPVKNVLEKLKFFKKNPMTGIATIFVLIFIFLAVAGPWLSPYDPYESNLKEALMPPGPDHLFGTDNIGRDIFSRVIYAAQVDFYIAVLAVFQAFIIGVSLGMISGYIGGRFDSLISRLVDMIMAFPLFVLAMGIVAALGNTIDNIIVATAIINIPFYLRMARAEVMVQKKLEYVDAARIAGNSTFSILFRHMLPNIFPTIVVQMSLNLGWAILNAAGLSFIGLGVRPPTPEWGILVAEGAAFVVSGEWWISLFPGLTLMLAVLSFNLLGDGLRDVFDVKTRK